MRRLCLHDLASSFATSLVSTFFFLHPDLTPTHVSQWCANLFMISTLKIISTGSQVRDPAKMFFSHPSFSYFLFSNPTHKTKTGTANRSEIRLIATHFQGPIKLSSQSTACVRLYSAFYLPHHCVEKYWAKPCIFLSEIGMFWLYLVPVELL